ncbi:MAG: molybdopterin-dependent oxidoreductase, partial [Betaproteobacteria bacterium]
SDISNLQSVLVIGSSLRKEQPLIANRLRQAAKKGLQLNIVHVADDELLMKVANAAVVAPSGLPAALAAVAKALAGFKESAIAPTLTGLVNAAAESPETTAIAKSLADNAKNATLLGNLAQHHPDATILHALAQEIARLSGGTFGFLGEAANSVGAAAIGAMPGNDGLCAQGMVAKPRKAYVLVGVEPSVDCYDPVKTMAALKAAELVVSLSIFKGDIAEYATVALPIVPFTETAGSFVNTEGTVQSFNGVVKPLGEARPAWKVLRVLGNLLDLPGFDQESVTAIRTEIAPDLQAFVNAKLNNAIAVTNVAIDKSPAGIERVGEVPIYASDALVRRAASLQKTVDAKNARHIFVASDVAENQGIVDGAEVRVTQGGASVILSAKVDRRLVAGCVRVASALHETSALGPMFGTVTLEKIAMAAAAE